MTCLCLTRNRREWLPQAIQCFLDQTYPARELLILSDGGDVRDLVPADERIRLLHLDGCSRIGEKRNVGCERARGSLIAHWDDDDYSAAGRLSDQVERLLASAQAVTGYRSMRFIECDTGRQWQYEGNDNYALGTSLVYRRDWWQGHPFPAVSVGEDNAFIQTAVTHEEFSSAPAGDLMYATLHPGNTSPKLMNSRWTRVC